MDLYFQFLLLFVLCIPLSLFFRSCRAKVPPGKMGWPVIGETVEFVFSGRNGNPEKFITERMNKYSAQVFKTSLFGENMAVFCGDSGNKFLFSNENKLVTSWWPRSVKKVLGFSSFPENSTNYDNLKKMRSFLPEFLKPESLQHYITTMDSMARQHLEAEWSPHREVKVFPLSKKYTFALACRLFLSIEDPAHVAKIAEPFTLITAGLISFPIDFPGTNFNRAIKAGRIVRRELLVMIRKRKMEILEKRDVPARDLLSCMLVATHENGKFLSEVEIASRILALLIASHDTASTIITFILSHLADLPHVYNEVLKEQMEIAKAKGPEELLNWDDIQKMKYSWNVANEAMRLAPPTEGAFREAISDFTYAGCTIPKGWKTHWSVHSTHRNPKYFPNPEKFDPSRFEGKGPAPYTFVPFGGGPRMCLGREYARLEILVLIHNVVTKFKWKKQIPNEKIIYNPSPVPENGLPIRLSPFS